MSRVSRRKIMIIVVIAATTILSIIIGKQINSFFKGLNEYHLMYECDTANKYMAMSKWFESRQNIVEILFHIIYIGLAVLILCMVVLELKNNIFPEKEIKYYCIFVIAAAIARNAIFGLNKYREIKVIILIIITVFISFLLECYYKRKEKIETDISYEELFDSRKNTVDEIIFELEHSSEFPKGIFIKGSWGAGKTTFINTVKDKLFNNPSLKNTYKIIELKVGYACDPAKLINEIESQLMSYLKEDYWYFDHEIVNNYFERICELFSGSTNGMSKSFYDLITGDDSKTDAEDRLNGFLKQYTNKKIIICIDDLERCPAENAKQIFAVLVNCLGLYNCITLLIADYDELLQATGISEHYLKKFFTVPYTIHEISFAEMAEKYLLGKNVIDQDIYDSNANIVGDYIRILGYYWNILDDYFDEYINLDSDSKSSAITDFLLNIKKSIHNPRDFKSIIDDIRNYVYKIYDIYSNKHDFYLSILAEHDIANTISIIVVLKKFFSNIWDEYTASGGWDKFTIAYATSRKYNARLSIEYDILKRTLLKDSFLDVALMDALVFGFKDIRTYDYVNIKKDIESKSFGIDALNDYINYFYNDNRLIVILGEYIIENKEDVNSDVLLNYCIRFTQSLNNGITSEKEKIDYKIYHMIWEYTIELNYDSRFKVDRIKKEKAEKTFSICQNNVAISVSFILKEALRNLDYLADWGYSAIANKIVDTSEFEISPEIILNESDKKNFESYISSILKYDDTLGLRDLADFIKLLGVYFDYYLGTKQISLLSKQEESLNKCYSNLRHINRKRLVFHRRD